MKLSRVYWLYKILKAIWRFIDNWWYIIIFGIAIYLFTKIDEIL